MKPILYKLICSLPVTLFAGTGTQVFGQKTPELGLYFS